MTSEEIQDARDLIAKATDTPWNDGAVNIVIANMQVIAKARTLLLKAIDALEGARRENALLASVIQSEFGVECILPQEVDPEC